LFFSILLLAHFQAAIIPILLGIRSTNKFKHLSKNKFIPFGFIFLGLASISEMIDHTQTFWIYVDHSSLYNWLFYSFLSIGLTCLSISVIKNKFIQKTNFCISLCSIISYFLLDKSIFAVSKSGTVSLEICNAKVPSIIIYKMNFLNFLIVKMLVKIKFANIINIINNKEIIPELIQKECNAKEIYNSVVYFLKNPELMKKQINDCEETLTKIRSKTSSSDEASSVLTKFLIS